MAPVTLKETQNKNKPIGIVGLGYVGLPLACLLAKKYHVIGFDISETRVGELRKGFDRTKEIESKEDLTRASLSYTTDPQDLSSCPYIIVAVPTPIDEFKKPHLGPVESASRAVGRILQPGTIVCYESTVYPGVTEEVCGTILEKESGLKSGRDFYLGYSPERVNPGDKEHTIDKITKVVSGQTDEVAEILCELYGSVVSAGIHKAPTIMTAEAAKVIENTQRDLNIGLINELATIFDEVGLDTLDVLEAAGTKWNFLPFRPGLVGGHCIGVDPYYLTYMAEGKGLHPQVIQAGRRINDSMGGFIAKKALSLILNSSGELQKPVRVAILGATFKENVPDIRNTKVVSVAQHLIDSGVEVFISDPMADPDEFSEEYKMELTKWEDVPACDALILAVKHDYFVKDMPLASIMAKSSSKKILLDLKSIINREEARELGVNLWRL